MTSNSFSGGKTGGFGVAKPSLSPRSVFSLPPPLSTQMKKVMLTVFKHNHGAYQFFREALQ